MEMQNSTGVIHEWISVDVDSVSLIFSRSFSWSEIIVHDKRMKIE